MRRQKNLTVNELFSNELIHNVSVLLGLPENVVSTVIDAMVLYILKDVANQFDRSDTATISIPRIGHIVVKDSPRRSILIDNTYLTPIFRDKVHNATKVDYDPLFQAFMDGSDDLIIDHFTKVIRDGVTYEDDNE